MLAYDAATDGCFPLITNDTTLTDAEVLAAYRYQPNLERRHHLLKSVQDAAPVLLRSPARIEALFCCQFLALLLGALIERQIRTAMTAAATDHLPLYPELRGCTAPSTERILEIFADLARHELTATAKSSDLPTRAQPPARQVLDLLGAPPPPTPSTGKSAVITAQMCGTRDEQRGGRHVRITQGRAAYSSTHRPPGRSAPALSRCPTGAADRTLDRPRPTARVVGPAVARR